MIGIKIERDHFESILVLSFARTSKLNMFCIICYLQENTLPIYDWIVDLSTCRRIMRNEKLIKKNILEAFG